MKRFHCTQCKRIKRVRHLPKNTINVTNLDPNTRLGKCDYHSYNGSHREYNRSK